MGEIRYRKQRGLIDSFQQPAETVWVVRGDSIDTHPDHAAHFTGFVHGPYAHETPLFLGQADQRGRDEFPQRKNGVGARPRKPAKRL
jgi:hypothetical protein